MIRKESLGNLTLCVLLEEIQTESEINIVNEFEKINSTIQTENV